MIEIVQNQTGANIIALCALIVSVATLVAAFIGLKTWRRQLKGTHNYELAKRISLASYELRYAIEGVRAPFVPPDYKGEYQKRWSLLLDPAKQLKSGLFEAKIVWTDDDVVKISSALDKLLAELNTAIDMYLLSKQEAYKDMANELFTKEQAYILYRDREQPTDKYAQKVNKLVEDIEKLVRPKMKL